MTSKIPTDLETALDADRKAEDYFDGWRYDKEICGYTVDQVEDVGGEGQGDTYYKVYSFTKNGQKLYIQFDGRYNSYDGAELEEWFPVTPEQKMITVYNRVN